MRGILDPVSGRAFLADLLPFQAQGRAHRRGQRPRPDAAQADRAGRARHLSGHRAVGPVAGRSRQPPAGRLRAARRPGSPSRGRRPSCCATGGAAASSSTSWRGRWRCGARVPELFSQGDYLPLTLAGRAGRADRRVRAPRPAGRGCWWSCRAWSRALLPDGDGLLPAAGGMGRHRARAARRLGRRRGGCGGGRPAHRPRAQAAGGGHDTGGRAAGRAAGGAAGGRGGRAVTARRGLVRAAGVEPAGGGLAGEPGPDPSATRSG